MPSLKDKILAEEAEAKALEVASEVEAEKPKRVRKTKVKKDE